MNIIFWLLLAGPADYTPEKVLNLEHKYYFSFGSRKPLHKPRDTPGNGAKTNGELIDRFFSNNLI